MTINYCKIKDIKLYSNFSEFCKANTSCQNCDLKKHGLIRTDYGQPCRQVYELLLLIDDFATIIKGQDVLIKGIKKEKKITWN